MKKIQGALRIIRPLNCIVMSFAVLVALNDSVKFASAEDYNAAAERRILNCSFLNLPIVIGTDVRYAKTLLTSIVECTPDVTVAETSASLDT
jgi:hypothetical protein